jgi:hypothetical protein
MGGGQGEHGAHTNMPRRWSADMIGDV